MTTPKTTAKAVAPKEVITPKEEPTKTPATFEGAEISDKPVALAEGDTSHELSTSVSTHDLSPNVEMDDSKESKEVIKEDEKVKEAISNGEVSGLTGAQISVLSQPLVPHPETQKPVYATNEQWVLSQAAAGKLSTPSE